MTISVAAATQPTAGSNNYRHYIIDLYGVKNSTMSYYKCSMPSLSCLLSFYTIPISLFFNSKIFFYFLVLICIKIWYIVFTGFSSAREEMEFLLENLVGLACTTTHTCIVNHIQHTYAHTSSCIHTCSHAALKNLCITKYDSTLYSLI